MCESSKYKNKFRSIRLPQDHRISLISLLELFVLFQKRSWRVISEWKKSSENESDFFFCDKRCNFWYWYGNKRLHFWRLKYSMYFFLYWKEDLVSFYFLKTKLWYFFWAWSLIIIKYEIYNSRDFAWFWFLATYVY